MKKHTWKIIAVVLMLIGIIAYVATMDEAVPPGAVPNPQALPTAPDAP